MNDKEKTKRKKLGERTKKVPLDEFTEKIFETFGKDTFIKLETNPPNTRELKDPQLYLNRIK